MNKMTRRALLPALAALAAVLALAAMAVGATPDQCPPDCSGHGTRNTAGRCECAAGYTGGDCQYGDAPPLPGYCHSIGDPHFVALSGAKYSYQGTGVFWLLRSDDAFFAQTWTTKSPRNERVALNRALFVRYGATEVLVEGEPGTTHTRVTVDGAHVYTNAAPLAAPAAHGALVLTTDGAHANRFVLTFRAYLGGAYRAAEFVVTSGHAAASRTAPELTFLAIYVRLGDEWAGRVHGLCDEFRADHAMPKTLTPRDATEALAVTAPNVARFAASWHVDCAHVAFAGFDRRDDCVHAPPPVYVPPSCDFVAEHAPSVCALACSYAEQCLHDVHAHCNLSDAQQHVAAFEMLREHHKWAQCGGSWCSPCSGHGVCNDGACTCDAGFTGVHCQTAHEDVSCPDDCSGHGWCRFDGRCMCHDGFGGANCATETRPRDDTECHRRGCSGHGACNSHGVCACERDYYGSQCQHRKPRGRKTTCTAEGDPHYYSFDNEHYSYQGAGVYHQVVSQRFEVQSWHKPWVNNPRNLIQIGIAIRYDHHTLELYGGVHASDPHIRVGGHTTAWEPFWAARRNAPLTLAPGIVLERVGNWYVRLTLPEGQIYVSVARTGTRTTPQHYMNVVSHIDYALFDNVHGMCGRWDDHRGRGFCPRGAHAYEPFTAAVLNDDFGPSWQVPCDRVLLGEMPRAECEQAPHTFEVTTPAPCEEVRELAEAACKQACTSYEQCVHDVFAACDVEMAHGHIGVAAALADIWDGPACVEEVPLCASNCSGHGICVANGECHCLPGFGGSDCSIEECPGDCSGHGSCHDGGCCCHAFWAGEACDTPTCTGACSGHGTCSAPETCTCDAHFTGATCADCADGFRGADCAERICPGTSDAQPAGCSGHGSCDGATGACACDAFWAGAACDSYAPRLEDVVPRVQCRLPGATEVPQLAGTPAAATAAALVFGYANANPETYALPAGGEHNVFTTGAGVAVAAGDVRTVANGAGQPSDFAPGTSAAFPAAGVLVGIDDADAAAAVSWTLGTTTVTGSRAATPLCDLPCAASADCSGRGSCVAGTCVCDAGAAGAACNVDVGAPGGALTPAFMCVQWASATSSALVALFAYDNTASETLFVAAGTAQNAFSTAAPPAAQPSHFAPGTSATFSVPLPADAATTPLTWTLAGTTVTADAAHFCQLPCPADCSGHGACQAGRCACDELYSGADCATPVLSLDRVEPRVHCVTAVNDAATNQLVGFSATFGYVSTNAADMTVSRGAHNALAPASLDGAQPTLFSGPAAVEAAFTVQLPLTGAASDVRHVAWTLGARTALAAFDSSVRCPVACPADCSGHGACDTATGQCTCDSEHAGPDCSQWAIDYSKIVPSVLCVVEQFDGTMRAYFGYTNDNEVAVTLPAGPNNKFVGSAGATAVGTPLTTDFAAGEHGAFPDAAESTTFLAGQSVSWIVGGNVATASASSERCAPTAPVVPVFRCVRPASATAWAADFTYVNPNAFVVTTPVGDDNTFAAASSDAATPADLGQPTRFGQSTTTALAAPFTVEFDGYSGARLVWTLNGAEAAASNASLLCADAEPFCPAPVALTLANSLASIDLVFNAPLAGAQIGATTPCAGLVQNAAAALGASATCTFISAGGAAADAVYGVRIVPSDDAALVPGGALTLVSGAAEALLGAACIAREDTPSVTLAPPAAPVAPLAVVNGPTSQVQCGESLDLSGTASLGGGYRALQFAWSTVSAPTPADASALDAQFAAQAGATDVSLATSALGAGTYIVRLTVTNLLGIAASATHTFVLQSRAGLVSLTISGPSSFDLNAGTGDLVLDATLVDPCGALPSGSDAIDYEWSETLAGTIPPGQIKHQNDAQLVIKHQHLDAGKTYMFEVTVTDTTSGVVLGHATHQVVVSGGKLALEVIGAGTVLASDAVDVHVQLINAAPGVGSTFTWTCSYKQGRRDKTCYTIDNAVVALPTGDEFSATPYTLRFGTYQFEVVVQHGAQTASIKFDVDVSSTASLAPSTDLQLPIADSVPSDAIQVAVSSQVPVSRRLRSSDAADTQHAAVTWTVAHGELAGPTSRCLVPSDDDAHTLVLARQCMHPQTVYVLHAHTPGLAEPHVVAFRTGPAPVGGRMLVHTLAGERLAPHAAIAPLTRVRVAVHGVSHATHARLLFDVSARLRDGTLRALIAPSPHSSFVVAVPPHAVGLESRIVDPSGAEHTVVFALADAATATESRSLARAATVADVDALLQAAARSAAHRQFGAALGTMVEALATIATLPAADVQTALDAAVRALQPLVERAAARRELAPLALSTLQTLLDDSHAALTPAQLDVVADMLAAIVRSVSETSRSEPARSRRGALTSVRALSHSERAAVTECAQRLFASLDVAAVPRVIAARGLVALRAVARSLGVTHGWGHRSTVELGGAHGHVAVATVHDSHVSGARVSTPGGAAVQLPAGASASELTGGAAGAANVVSLQVVHAASVTGTHLMGEAAAHVPGAVRGRIVSSGVVDVSIAHSDGTPLPVADLPAEHAIRIELPLADANARPMCAFWSADASQWSTEGVSTQLPRDSHSPVVCMTRHLTAFALIEPEPLSLALPLGVALGAAAALAAIIAAAVVVARRRRARRVTSRGAALLADVDGVAVRA